MWKQEEESNAGHAGRAMVADGGDGGHREGAGGGAHEAAVKENVDVGDGKDAAEKAPTRTVVARSRLPGVMAAAPKPPIMVPPR